jgi:hypothetical protein
MSEALTQSPNLHISLKKKVASAAAALLILGGFGAAVKRGVSPSESFKTDIPVPTLIQPHIDYEVQTGDTESSIASHFNVYGYNTLDYENMINEQLPKSEQPKRDVHPGDNLRLPPVTQ